MSMKRQLQSLARSVLAPLLYRYPPFTLQPERLYLFLDAVVQTKDIPGSVVEIGCNLGGTAVIAKQVLKNLGSDKHYVCIDTFGGFVGKQFDTDVALGTPVKDKELFSGSSKALVSQIMQQHHCSEIELVQGDIITLPESSLPKMCSVVLADVDLTEPTFVSLKRLWPRMSPGGIMLVDDCQENSSWKAGIGYARFCSEQGLQENYRYGMGILRR